MKKATRIEDKQARDAEIRSSYNETMNASIKTIASAARLITIRGLMDAYGLSRGAVEKAIYGSKQKEEIT